MCEDIFLQSVESNSNLEREAHAQETMMDECIKGL